MKLKITLYMAYRNLIFKRLRSLLTIAGVIIGIGSIFMLVSFGLGLQNLVQSQVIGSQSVKTIDVSSPNSKALVLDQDNKNRFANLAHVEAVGHTFSYAGRIELERANTEAVVYGVDTDYLNLSGLSVVAGKLLNPDNEDELMINSALLEAIGQKDIAKAVGKEIAISIDFTGDKEAETKTFKIVGVINSGNGSEIFMPDQFFRAAGVKTFSQVKLLVDERDNVGTVRKQIESQGFETASPIDTLEQINQVFKFFNFILVGFGSIGLLIAVLGMLNTLTISLIERTQEVGLMIALGGRRQDMRRLFIAEALLLSLIGGIAGMLLSRTLGIVLDFVMNRMAASRGVVDSFTLFSTPLWLITVVMLFMIGIGLLVAIVPARRAARINPIDALRHE